MIDLADATRCTSGGKAAALGRLLRAGLPVPDGFVVPFAVHRALRAAATDTATRVLRVPVGAALRRLGDPPVAVRSSADAEDTTTASAAGQYESVLAVHGTEAVLGAIDDCWESGSSPRVSGYLARTGGPGTVAQPEMGVLVQRLIDADMSGVMFTPGDQGEPTRIESSWGLGLTVVGGSVMPDMYQVDTDGSVHSTVGTKATRADRSEDVTGVTSRAVPEHLRDSRTLDDATVVRLAVLGRHVTELLGGPQDIEWAIEDQKIWLLQARPITAAPPPPTHGVAHAGRSAALTGTPGAHGVATGPARVVRRLADFGRVRAGDILICPLTDPAWTPLFAVAAGVVTEVGGALSHAAIVAREYGIPAVLGVTDATHRIDDGAHVTIDGTAGTLVVH